MDILAAGAAQLGINLTESQLDRFETYYRELIEWNRRTNLTRITGYGEVQTRHFLDSLAVFPALEAELRPPGRRVIDIGSGAGMPGLPLKIALPDINLALLEATGKKAEFLAHVTRRLGLEDVEIKVGRAEDVARDSAYRETFDIALSRAVAGLPSLVELMLPFLAVGGTAVAMKKGDIAGEIDAAGHALAALGGRLREVMPVTVAGLEEGRCLVVIDKVGWTPEKYPRRAGLPVKRPLTSPGTLEN